MGGALGAAAVVWWPLIPGTGLSQGEGAAEAKDKPALASGKQGGGGDSAAGGGKTGETASREEPPPLRKLLGDSGEAGLEPASFDLPDSRELPAVPIKRPPRERWKYVLQAAQEANISRDTGMVRARRRAAELSRSGLEALREGRFPEAVRSLEGSLEAVPRQADARNNLAVAQWRSGNRSAAVDTLIRGLERYPGSAPMAANLAHLLLREELQDRRKAGLVALTEAVERQDGIALYVRVGRLLAQMGRNEEAVAVYRQGMARKDSHWRLSAGLGLALEALGRSAEAREAYRRARQALPQGRTAWARALRARLGSLKGGD